jgi:hypothetical protein
MRARRKNIYLPAEREKYVQMNVALRHAMLLPGTAITLFRVTIYKLQPRGGGSISTAAAFSSVVHNICWSRRRHQTRFLLAVPRSLTHSDLYIFSQSLSAHSPAAFASLRCCCCCPHTACRRWKGYYYAFQLSHWTVGRLLITSDTRQSLCNQLKLKSYMQFNVDGAFSLPLHVIYWPILMLWAGTTFILARALI